MRLSPTSLTFLCFFLFGCNGAPPTEEDFTSSNSRGVNFTDKEDELITNAISRLSAAHVHKLSSKQIWEQVAKKHHEKWQQKTPGFPQERSVESLRHRFRKLAAPDDPELSINMPKDVMRKFRPDLNKPARGKNPPYTPEEEEVIFEELLKPSCHNLFSLSTREAMQAEYAARKEALIPGFETERTLDSINSRIRKLKETGHLPDEVVKKFRLPAHDKGASSSKSTVPNKRSATEVPIEEDED